MLANVLIHEVLPYLKLDIGSFSLAFGQDWHSSRVVTIGNVTRLKPKTTIHAYVLYQQGIYIGLNSRDNIRSHFAQYYRGLAQPESNIPVISVPYVDFSGLGTSTSRICYVILQASLLFSLVLLNFCLVRMPKRFL